MGMRIEETFDVAASPARVWSFLVDPAQVVACLPGAELTGVDDARNFQGRVRVKVGPVTASFRGKARFEELDEAGGRVRMTGEGQDTTGAGTARMRMTSRIEAVSDGAARVRVEADVDVAGRIAQFGRGMMEEVTRQLFRQFAECVRARLEADTGRGEPDAGASPATTASGSAAAAAPAAQAAGANAIRILPLLRSALVALLKRLFRRR